MLNLIYDKPLAHQDNEKILFNINIYIGILTRRINKTTIGEKTDEHFGLVHIVLAAKIPPGTNLCLCEHEQAFLEPSE